MTTLSARLSTSVMVHISNYAHYAHDPKKYRAVSGLPFISKLVDRVVAAQVTNHINVNDLGERTTFKMAPLIYKHSDSGLPQ